MCVLSASGTAATVNFAALGLSEPLAAARCDSREVRSALRLDASLTSQVRGEGDCDSREVRSALRLDASLTSQVRGRGAATRGRSAPLSGWTPVSLARYHQLNLINDSRSSYAPTCLAVSTVICLPLTVFNPVFVIYARSRPLLR